MLLKLSLKVEKTTAKQLCSACKTTESYLKGHKSPVLQLQGNLSDFENDLTHRYLQHFCVACFKYSCNSPVLHAQWSLFCKQMENLFNEKSHLQKSCETVPLTVVDIYSTLWLLCPALKWLPVVGTLAGFMLFWSSTIPLVEDANNCEIAVPKKLCRLEVWKLSVKRPVSQKRTPKLKYIV